MQAYVRIFATKHFAHTYRHPGNDDGNTIIDVIHPKTLSCCFYAYAFGKCMESLPLSAIDYVGHYYEVKGGLR